jgi:hypothetical protein
MDEDSCVEIQFLKAKIILVSNHMHHDKQGEFDLNHSQIFHDGHDDFLKFICPRKMYLTFDELVGRLICELLSFAPWSQTSRISFVWVRIKHFVKNKTMMRLTFAIKHKALAIVVVNKHIGCG